MGWKETARVFDESAAEYDRWFEKNLIFETELAAIKGLHIPNEKPALEIGVGPGRFAASLGVNLGMDPALAALKFAGGRALSCFQGTGEKLAVKNDSLGSVYLLLTFCFLDDPHQVLTEIARALDEKGTLVIGMIPASGPWGLHLQAKKEAGNPFYRHANFYTIAAVEKLLHETGFTVKAGCSTLYQLPDRVHGVETPRDGLDENAGFTVLVARKVKHV
jgi:SAM-dependent methyltransferase